MEDKMDTKPTADRELIITRTLKASPENLYRCWTEPALIKQWFCPKPWGVSHAEVDPRPGGRSMIVMRSPEGQEFPNAGVYLEAVPGKKLVFTDAFVGDWEPAGEPFMVGIVTFEDNGDGTTLYTARVRHWTEDATKRHEQMGFHEGWSKCAEQLEDLARTL
jgi:uncharacterized protein YndB with AHSA1/START domain